MKVLTEEEILELRKSIDPHNALQQQSKLGVKLLMNMLGQGAMSDVMMSKMDTIAANSVL